jgi:antitoxin component of MazEF toxin-antitoxin module
MEVILRKYGNSTVAVLPPAVHKDLGLSAGQAMSLDTTAQGQIVLSRKRRYVLADMIAQCDRKAPPPADLARWDTNTLGDVLAAPITQGGDFSRCAGFAVSLTGPGCRTQGVALIDKVRMLDLAARKARRIERAPQAVIDEALGRLMALLDC